MYKITLKNNDTIFAQDLVKITSKYEEEIFIKKEKYIVDGKSILGILSLGGLNGATLECENPTKDFVEDLFELVK